MLIFILWFIIFVLAGQAAIWLLWRMIQHGQVFDVLFGWQKMLASLYDHPKKWKDFLGKALGNCEMCMATQFQWLWFLCFYGFSRGVLHWFPTYEVSWRWKVPVMLVMMVCFNASGAVLGTFTLLRAKLKFKRHVSVSE